MDYFYAPYRKDFVKECEKFMSFDQLDEEGKIIDWGSISKFVLSDQK